MKKKFALVREYVRGNRNAPVKEVELTKAINKKILRGKLQVIKVYWKDVKEKPKKKVKERKKNVNSNRKGNS